MYVDLYILWDMAAMSQSSECRDKVHPQGKMSRGPSPGASIRLQSRRLFMALSFSCKPSVVTPRQQFLRVQLAAELDSSPFGSFQEHLSESLEEPKANAKEETMQ